MTAMLRGAITALVTPFTRDGAVDEKALRALVEWQVAEGIHGLVPVGSTGEAVTLSLAERAPGPALSRPRRDARVYLSLSAFRISRLRHAHP